MHRPCGPRVAAYGWVPGWHGRVRYCDGRWGYLRGRDWYWYDVYYETDYFYSQTVACFQEHLSQAGKEVAGAVGVVTPQEIDQINILNASILAMHRALDQLQARPEAIIVDGNRFKPYRDLPHTTIVKGDGKYLSIAAASILAKTYRDDEMVRLAQEYPDYDWQHNMGYPTRKHREAIRQHGITPYHRRTFNLLGSEELTIPFDC